MSQHEVYKEQIREAILQRSGDPMLNDSVDHASIIVQEAFNSAQNEVRILSYKLDPDCYARDSVQHALNFFLANPTHRAKILIESGLWDSEGTYEWVKHPLLKNFAKFTAPKAGETEAQLTIKLMPKSLCERYGFNLLLLDDYGYRYESDRNRPVAVASFLPKGDEAKMENLNTVFTNLWENEENNCIRLI